MSGSLATGLAVLVPLIGVLFIAAAHRHPNHREAATLATAAALFILVVSLVRPVMGGARPGLELVEIFPGLALAFEVEPLGLLFALVASFLWIVTSIYSIGYMRGHNEQNQTRFYISFAIALSAAIGVAFAANMLTLFVCYEMLTLSTYPLVTHSGDDKARRSGRIYLGILLGTSIGFQLLAILWTWSLAGTLDFTVGGILAGKASPGLVSVLLVLYIFGIGKAALMPFHRWLPAAMVAPTPVSALLHAVAVVKAGVFTVLKVSVYIFGLDLLSQVEASRWLMYVAAGTILIASVTAMRQDNLKLRLAYSTISQLSYIVLGAMLANGLGVIGGGMHIAMHAFGKITLFFCAGAIMVAAHKTEISEMYGIGRVMPVTMAAFLIGSLSIIGAPPMAGLWSKWHLVLGTLEADSYVMLGVFLTSSLLSVGYLMPLAMRAFFVAPGEGAAGNPGNPETRGVKEAPLPCLIAISVSALGCIVLFLFPEPVHHLMTLVVAQ
ncbi:MAG: proton-conducting transporter membrane subunit [Alphaproteobacteria bacterium]|jgi:multicomponent Na+:H+ antiporter subunit D|nr:cation:proton antiporter [Rhodospirillaceae bacterium]MDP6404829.1 proton-conducting transporter membrane subunit [Alphaproteobacteria bacterium]